MRYYIVAYVYSIEHISSIVSSKVDTSGAIRSRPSNPDISVSANLKFIQLEVITTIITYTSVASRVSYKIMLIYLEFKIPLV